MAGVAPLAAHAQSAPVVAFVPLDDRPVTWQLPVMLGAIAGQRVVTPPRTALGHYLEPGDPEAILRWLDGPDARLARSWVVSSDMLAYGGLVAARTPQTGLALAQSRIARFAAMARERPRFVSAFGTIMRLAPTGVPALGPASDYWATGATVDEIQQYANLPDPPQTAEQRAYAARLRERIGPALETYFATRARDLYVDLDVLHAAAGGSIDRVVLGQDDAGPVGVHLRDVRVLDAAVRSFGLGSRASIEPGADELGMMLVAQAFARNVGWRPRVRVEYSHAGAGATQDRLEFAPIDVTIGRIVAACGAERVEARADVTLFVKVAGTSSVDEAAFEDAIAAAVGRSEQVAVADLTFLSGEPGPEQRELTEALIARRLAGRIDGFASWNTDANTVGTALAAALAAGAGRRAGTYDARAHAEFMLDRYADDYAFHQFVRPELNAALRARGIDTTLLLPPVAGETQARNRALLWPYAVALLGEIYPDYVDAGLTVSLPWDRTFETALDVRLAPQRLGASPAPAASPPVR